MNAVVNRYPCSSSRGVIVLHHNSRIRDRPTREADGHPNVKTAVQLCQSTHSGPHGQNRASLLMNPMYSIARTRQCPRKSCSPRQPMAAYMWNGLQPVTSFTLIPNPNPQICVLRHSTRCRLRLHAVPIRLQPGMPGQGPYPCPYHYPYLACVAKALPD